MRVPLQIANRWPPEPRTMNAPTLGWSVPSGWPNVIAAAGELSTRAARTPRTRIRNGRIDTPSPRRRPVCRMPTGGAGAFRRAGRAPGRYADAHDGPHRHHPRGDAEADLRDGHGVARLEPVREDRRRGPPGSDRVRPALRARGSRGRPRALARGRRVRRRRA